MTDQVVYRGASDAQVRWGHNEDPRGLLVEGQAYTVAAVDQHTWYTRLRLREFPDCWFNSVHFEE